MLEKILIMKREGFNLGLGADDERWEGGRYSIEEEERRQLRETVPPRRPPRFEDDDVEAFNREIEALLPD